jgi:hypothetical protein
MPARWQPTTTRAWVSSGTATAARLSPITTGICAGSHSWECGQKDRGRDGGQPGQGQQDQRGLRC